MICFYNSNITSISCVLIYDLNNISPFNITKISICLFGIEGTCFYCFSSIKNFLPNSINIEVKICRRLDCFVPRNDGARRIFIRWKLQKHIQALWSESISMAGFAWFEVKHTLEVDTEYSFVVLRGEDIIESTIGDGHIFASLSNT